MEEDYPASPHTPPSRPPSLNSLPTCPALPDPSLPQRAITRTPPRVWNRKDIYVIFPLICVYFDRVKLTSLSFRSSVVKGEV
ncbi:hypothetical protein E2C01_068850 [Portunus trituberculatus]|uniref:Uncharacterized protein n=1 Tax=Portunus trituberculatus TaxID=210409 RepID=A0A5B7HPX0_PORTR|nr:hypothetical protein [Portunus trituberculatus]